MTYFHACVGCAHDKATCNAFLTFKENLKGLGITSVKWRCAERRDRFHIGQPVWALTTCFYGGDYQDDWHRDEWPGHIIRLTGSTALVYIEPGADAKDHGHGDLPFEPKSGGRGFCKIPLSRLKTRIGDDETICKQCELPSYAGHQAGYACSVALARAG